MTETNWNDLAHEYTSRDFTRKDWVYGYQPVLELLGDINGKKILDYGCGSGKFSRILAEKGAEVTAVDPTERMLALARAQNCQRVNYQRINYQRIVDNDISFVNAIDDAVATYVLCGRADDQEIRTIIKYIYDKLPVGGSFVVLDPHPMNRSGADRSGLVRICLEGMQNPIFDYWRPVEKYVSFLQEGGFTPDTVLEPKDEQGNPQMLILRGRKCIR